MAVEAVSVPRDEPAVSFSTPHLQQETQRQPRVPFIWPVAGGISSHFEPGHPLGIDISLSRSPEAPIRATATGRVTFAGGNPCCGYGLYVILDHGSGLTSRYGHLSRVDVVEGDGLRQGDILGLGGNTGLSTAAHLHFEIRAENEPIDPLPMLPAPCEDVPGTLYQYTAVTEGSCAGSPLVMSGPSSGHKDEN